MDREARCPGETMDQECLVRPQENLVGLCEIRRQDHHGSGGTRGAGLEHLRLRQQDGVPQPEEAVLGPPISSSTSPCFPLHVDHLHRAQERNRRSKRPLVSAVSSPLFLSLSLRPLLRAFVMFTVVPTSFCFATVVLRLLFGLPTSALQADVGTTLFSRRTRRILIPALSLRPRRR